ncbi:hypothetical protein H4S04_006631, partial [Coemansia sp. S16]
LLVSPVPLLLHRSSLLPRRCRLSKLLLLLVLPPAIRPKTRHVLARPNRLRLRRCRLSRLLPPLLRAVTKPKARHVPTWLNRIHLSRLLLLLALPLATRLRVRNVVSMDPRRSALTTT